MTTLFAGVDLGGTTIAAALADREGQVVAEAETATNSHEGSAAVIARIHRMVSELVTKSGASLQAVGVGVPGLVDVARGITRFLPNLPTQWRDVAVADQLQATLGCPVHLLNDVRTATLGELAYGHGRDADSSLTMTFFSIGTGIGGGVVVDGRLRLGPLGAAGELGHQTILPDGPRCGCGNRGCLEALASGPALASEGIRLMRMGLAPGLFDLVSGNPALVTPREMLACGDESTREAISRAAQYLGIAVANVVTVLHPDLVVLGGGVAELGDALLEPVRETVRRRVGMFPTDGVRIEKSQLGDRAGILGAIALAVRGGVN
ncbi:MAG: ROK family protein [Planctomycetes bacterium]|nr:ROK family protein [Planctomycetota bacterium]